jgi:hypothetical protein
MSNSGDRFYMLEMRNRPVFHGDIGSLLKIDGLVVGGGGNTAILLLPSASIEGPLSTSHAVVQLTNEQWVDFLQRSDVPELMGPEKAFHRKARYEISGLVQQKVYAADGFKCMFCNRKMGEVQLTVDHFNPIELGGVNNTSNYLSACRKCNKDKGSMDPKEWCRIKRLDYDNFVSYLSNRKV